MARNHCPFWARLCIHIIMLFPEEGHYVYIGISCYQDIIIEIDKTLNRLNIEISGLTIWLGYVNIQKSSYKRITKQIILDGERLMIITNQPNYNQQCKEKYYGRCNFKVRTSGCKYIRQCVRCENNRIYLSY